MDLLPISNDRIQKMFILSFNPFLVDLALEFENRLDLEGSKAMFQSLF